MTKKKRIFILDTSIFLLTLGFICAAILGTGQGPADGRYEGPLVICAFVLIGLSLFLLLKNYGKMVSPEWKEIEEKMRGEDDARFFSMVSIWETPQTLEERLTKAGFFGGRGGFF